jgi:hypothetical protein
MEILIPNWIWEWVVFLWYHCGPFLMIKLFECWKEWLEAGKLQRIVLVIMSKSTGEVLERWNFSIETDNEVVKKGESREKSDKEIMREIQAIMRQIASSITYLPCLDEPCMLSLLILFYVFSFLIFILYCFIS